MILTADLAFSPVTLELPEAYTLPEQEATLPYLLGLDINRFQANELLDPAAIRESGRDFVILEACWGMWESPTFKQFYPRLINADLVMLAYGFFRGDQDGAAQAQFLIDLARPMYDAQGFTMPLFCDVERFTGDTSTTAKRVGEWRKWVYAIRNAGFTPGVYSNASSWSTLMNNETLPADMLGWVAHYADTDTPYLPKNWTRAQTQFHQYGVALKYPWCPPVPGMASDVDVDKFYGTLEQLYALGSGVVPEPEPDDEPGEDTVNTEKVIELLQNMKTSFFAISDEVLEVASYLEELTIAIEEGVDDGGEPPIPPPPPPPPAVDTATFKCTADKANAHYVKGYNNAEPTPKPIMELVEQEYRPAFKLVTGEERQVLRAKVDADGSVDFHQIYNAKHPISGAALYYSKSDGKLID